MKEKSYGILLYRFKKELEVLLAHSGGPYWAGKDNGAWSIPKGRPDYPDEEPLSVALREVKEEVGLTLPRSIEQGLVPLAMEKTSHGNQVTIWACEGDFDVANFQSNHFTMEWPKNSGQIQSFPEMDAAAWFNLKTARNKIFPYQVPFLERLENFHNY